MFASNPDAARSLRNLGIAAIAASLMIFAQPKPAEAGGKWVGPAIAGAIIGAAIAHHGYRHYHKRHHKRVVRHRHRHHHRHGYHRHHPRPVVVVPFPVISFGFYPHW